MKFTFPSLIYTLQDEAFNASAKKTLSDDVIRIAIGTSNLKPVKYVSPDNVKSALPKNPGVEPDHFVEAEPQANFAESLSARHKVLLASNFNAEPRVGAFIDDGVALDKNVGTSETKPKPFVAIQHSTNQSPVAKGVPVLPGALATTVNDIPIQILRASQSKNKKIKVEEVNTKAVFKKSSKNIPSLLRSILFISFLAFSNGKLTESHKFFKQNALTEDGILSSDIAAGKLALVDDGILSPDNAVSQHDYFIVDGVDMNDGLDLGTQWTTLNRLPRCEDSGGPPCCYAEVMFESVFDPGYVSVPVDKLPGKKCSNDTVWQWAKKEEAKLPKPKLRVRSVHPATDVLKSQIYCMFQCSYMLWGWSETKVMKASSFGNPPNCTNELVLWLVEWFASYYKCPQGSSAKLVSNACSMPKKREVGSECVIDQQCISENCFNKKCAEKKCLWTPECKWTWWSGCDDVVDGYEEHGRESCGYFSGSKLKCCNYKKVA